MLTSGSPVLVVDRVGRAPCPGGSWSGLDFVAVGDVDASVDVELEEPVLVAEECVDAAVETGAGVR